MDSPVGNAPFAIDPSGRDILGDAERIRALGSVARVVMPGGVRAWAVSDAGLLRRLLVDPRVSKDAYQHWPEWIKGEIPADWPLFAWAAVRNMLNANGRDHRRLRGLVGGAFTARRVAGLRPRIEAITDELLDGLAGLPRDRPVDLREHYAYRLPITVICELLGIGDEAARTEASRCVDALFNIGSAPEETAAAFPRLQQILRELAAEKRERPGDDLPSALIAARDGDTPPLSEQELVDTLVLFVSAGHETTVNLLGNAIAAMLTRPDQLARVRGGDVTWADVIEETLRCQPPVPNLLARLVAAVALPALFERYPELVLATDPGELQPLESFVSNGYRAVPAWLMPVADEGDGTL